MLIGESYIGEGAEAAHVNTVFGERSGPVGVAWATALASPSAGHTPFVAVVIPGLPVKPMTLFVNKAPIAGDEHGTLTWGAAQAGVAGGVADAVSEGIISADEADQSVIIAAVWVNPAARDAEKVYANNRTATREALRAGAEGAPQMAEVLVARHRPFNPFYSPPSGGPEAAGSGAEGGGREPAASGADEESREPEASGADEESREPGASGADQEGREPAGSGADDEGREPAGSGAGEGGQAPAAEPQ
jgi:5,6,7,8-tetrahydromethanopterin hydro-lyase